MYHPMSERTPLTRRSARRRYTFQNQSTATSLISDECRSVGDANRRFSSEKGLLVLRPGRTCCSSFWFTIPSGCYALVTRHGADEDYDGSAVWPAGLHKGYPPWVKVSNLVTKQSVVFNLPVKACKTKDNVTVNVDVALVFRIMGDADRNEDPDLVRKFVHQVKPRGLEQQLRNAQEEAVRGLARSLRHTEIYGIRSGAGDGYGYNKEGEDREDEPERDAVFVGSSDAADRKNAERATAMGESVAAMMRDRLNRQFVSQGVEIQSVMIKSIKLPSDIMSQMTEKTMIISRNAQQRMYHENEMQNTRMEEEVQTKLQAFQEQREKEKSTGKETMNAERVKLNDARAQATQSEANIREETKVKLDNFRAENALEVQRVRDNMYESITKIKAEAEKESAELLANAEVETKTLLAASRLEAAKNEARANQILSKAEGKIAPWLEKKKEHVTREKQMDVYRELASNDELIISGSADGELNTVAVADAILQDLGRDDGDASSAGRSAILAELALVGKGSAGFLASSSSSARRNPCCDLPTADV